MNKRFQYLPISQSIYDKQEQNIVCRDINESQATSLLLYLNSQEEK